MSTKKYELMTAEEKFNKQDSEIQKAFASVESSMLKVGHAIYMIAKDSLHTVAGYNTVHDYAMDKYNIAKGAVSDAVNTFKFFCDENGDFKDTKYKDFTYSQLKLMRKLPAELLETITPDTSCRDIQNMINASKHQLEVKEDDSDSDTVSDDEADVEIAYPEDESEYVRPVMEFEIDANTNESLCDIVNSLIDAHDIPADTDIIIKIRR